MRTISRLFFLTVFAAVGVSFVFALAACAPGGAPGGSTGDLKDAAVGVDGGQAILKPNAMSASTVVIFMKEGKDIEFQCTGSLISANLVVLAGHCLGQGKTEDQPLKDSQSFYVLPGLTFNKSTYTVADMAKGVHVAKLDAAMHPGYSGYNHGAFSPDQTKPTHDIALLFLRNGPLHGVTPATLLPDDSALTPETSVLLAGYGPPTGQQDSNLVQLRYERSKVSESFWEKTGQIEIDNTKSRQMTNGDSGGPGFVINAAGHTLLWGVCSHGAAGDDDQFEVIQRHLDWIREQGAKWGADLNFKTEAM